MTVSLVYRHIYLYRLIMTILHGGRYNARFHEVIKRLNDSDRRILELCFGDVVIAQHCRDTGRSWIGLDINPSFVSYAQARGFDADLVDLSLVERLPAADVCVIVGSLYHFADEVESLFAKILAASRKLIISEPVVNLSNRPDLIGFLAKRAANAGKGHETFRYTKGTLLATLDSLGRKLDFRYKIENPDDVYLIAVIEHG